MTTDTPTPDETLPLRSRLRTFAAILRANLARGNVPEALLNDAHNALEALQADNERLRAERDTTAIDALTMAREIERLTKLANVCDLCPHCIAEGLTSDDC